MLARTPWFAAVVIFTLGVGIAVTSTVFSWIDAVGLRPLPGVGDAQQLALIETVTPGGEYLVNTSYLDYRDYTHNLTLVDGVALGRFTPLSVGLEGRTARAWAELVSPNYFDVLRVRPVIGRTFSADEARDQEGGAPVAIISYPMWQSRFGGDPNVLGKSIRLNRRDLTIIGVAPKGFHGSTVGVVYDVWVPITMATAMGTGGGTLHYRATRDETSTIVRLKPGVSIEQARSEVAALGRRLAAIYPDTNRGIDLTVTPVSRGHLGAQQILLEPLRILMGVAVILLLIVSANVGSLMLARAVSRQTEFGIRLALGAGASRIITQCLVETLLLAAGGAVVGLILTPWAGSSLVKLFSVLDVPLDLGGRLNARVFAFTFLVTTVAAMLAGLTPAMFAAKTDLNQTLKEAGRSGQSIQGSHRLRRLLVVLEMALVFVTLAGVVLFTRSFRNALRISPGFDPTNISVSQFYLSNAGYSAQEQHQFCRLLRQRLESMAGVVGVTYSDVTPMSTASGAGSTPWHQVKIDGYTPAPSEQMMMHRATVPPGYFDLLRIPILQGRDFTASDIGRGPLAMIVNETLANRYFARTNPIGRKVRCEGREAIVVGVVKDSKYHTPVEGPMPFFYLPFEQWFAPGLNFSVFVKTAGDPLLITPALRREALALNQDALFTTRLLSDANVGSLFAHKAAATGLGVIAAIAVLLAATGLYSVMSYTVSQRRLEMGIRIALGAQPHNVLGLLLKANLFLTIPGVLAGSALAAILGPVVRRLLVNVSAADPLTFAWAMLVLAVVAAGASVFPALRALRIDPMTTLRSE